MAVIPQIPTNIRVHLGSPGSNAPTITLPFADYIKNVASSEIYSTWDTPALRANILAQVSFALNRIYTEWYPSRGYDYDITNDTYYDQKFINGRNIYENISRIVDELFNDYLRKEGNINPFFAAYCNGTTVTCEGLSQWGSQTLANQGYTDVDILEYYYGDDIEIVVNAPIAENIPSYPDTPLKKGDLNESVRRMQIYLSRISGNYPAIPKIPVINGAFDENTENAVKTFQKIFSLTPDGIIEKATWYKIVYIYDSVTRLAELDSEGIGYENIPKQFKSALKVGDTGGPVVTVQYFLTLLGRFVEFLPDVTIDGIYGQGTANAVSAFQRYKGLPATGEIDERTWESLYSAYKGVVDYLEKENQLLDVPTQPYPGVVLKRGDVGPSVRIVKEYLAYIGRVFFEAQPLSVNNIFDLRTQNAVREFQRIFELPQTGQIDETTWNTITDVYRTLRLGQQRLPGQYPGRTLKEG